ncbi:MAG: DUF2164 domain-containing protein [Pseudomonadota bacterium]
MPDEPIAFAPEDRDLLSEQLRAYVADELDHEISGFEAGFLLDWIASEMGPAFYNQGVLDARAVMDERLGEATEALEGLIKGAGGERR